MLKVFSTPRDPLRAIVEAITKIAAEDDFILLHGTTVGTNALLERKGARAGLRKGKSYRGPAMVTEHSATTAVPPGKSFRIDPAGNLIIREG